MKQACINSCLQVILIDKQSNKSKIKQVIIPTKALAVIFIYHQIDKQIPGKKDRQLAKIYKDSQLIQIDIQLIQIDRKIANIDRKIANRDRQKDS